MTPANPDALADALVKCLAENDHRSRYRQALALIAGPLAPLLADLQRVTAERDAAREEAYDLKLAAAGGEDVPGSANLVTAEDVRRWRDEETLVLSAAEARAAQLQAEVEAKDMRIAVLTEALEPFAWFGEVATPDTTQTWAGVRHTERISTRFRHEHFRAARTALAARAATAREGQADA